MKNFIILALISFSTSAFSIDRVALDQAIQTLAQAEQQMEKAQKVLSRAQSNVTYARQLVQDAINTPTGVEMTCSMSWFGGGPIEASAYVTDRSELKKPWMNACVSRQGMSVNSCDAFWKTNVKCY